MARQTCEPIDLKLFSEKCARTKERTVSGAHSAPATYPARPGQGGDRLGGNRRQAIAQGADGDRRPHRARWSRGTVCVRGPGRARRPSPKPGGAGRRYSAASSRGASSPHTSQPASRSEAPFLLLPAPRRDAHERVGIGPEFRDDEWHALGHQAGNERDVAREAIELGNEHRTFRLARCG